MVLTWARHVQHIIWPVSVTQIRTGFRDPAVSLWLPISARTFVSCSDWADFKLVTVPAERKDHGREFRRTLQLLSSNWTTDQPLKEQLKTTDCKSLLCQPREVLSSSTHVAETSSTDCGGLRASTIVSNPLIFTLSLGAL
jgi:hypothetical protein